MADAKISALTVLAAVAQNDLVPIVDVSDTSQAASGTTKRVTADVLRCLPDTASLYVDTSGNDSTATRGRRDCPFATIDAALDASSAGDTIRIGVGTFGPVDPTKMKSGISYRGSGKPHVNSRTAPTNLVGGTIIRGPLGGTDVANVEIHDLGLDSGSDVCTAYYAGSPVNGVSFGAPAGHPSYGSNPPKAGVVVNNVIVLCQSVGAAVHAFLLENLIGLQATNLESWYGTHGVVIKALESNVSGLNTHGHSLNCVIVKANAYAACSRVNLSNVTMACVASNDSGGMRIHSEDSGEFVSLLNVNNVVARGTSFGLLVTTSSGAAGRFMHFANFIGDTGTGAGCSIENGQDIVVAASKFANYAGGGVVTDASSARIWFNNVRADSNTGAGFLTAGSRIYLGGCNADSNATYGYNNTGTSTYADDCSGTVNGTSLITGNALLLRGALTNGSTAPIAQYNLASLADAVGSFTLTDHGTVTFTAGKVGNAATFNGTTQWLTSSANVASQNLTIAFWVKFTTGQAKYVITQWGDGVSSNNNRWQCYLNTDDTISFVVAAPGTATVTTGVLAANTWHFIVLQWNESTFLTRISANNGSWISVTASGGMSIPGGSTPAPFSIGATGDGTLPFAGQVDAMRVFNAIAPDAELTTLYNGGSGTES